MRIDLSNYNKGGTWIRQFGDHEGEGLTVSLGIETAHVGFDDWHFHVRYDDVPEVKAFPIPYKTVIDKCLKLLVDNMTVDILEELLSDQRHSILISHQNGYQKAQADIRAALGIR